MKSYCHFKTTLVICALSLPLLSSAQQARHGAGNALNRAANAAKSKAAAVEVKVLSDTDLKIAKSKLNELGAPKTNEKYKIGDILKVDQDVKPNELYQWRLGDQFGKNGLKVSEDLPFEVGDATLIFIGALVEFLLVKEASTSTFAIMLIIALVDVLGGWSVAVRTARRDFSIDSQAQ